MFDGEEQSFDKHWIPVEEIILELNSRIEFNISPLIKILNPSATKSTISPVTVQDWEKSELRFGLEVPYRPAPHCTALSTAAPPLTEGLLVMIALWQMIAEATQSSNHHSRNHCHGVECVFEVHHCHRNIDNFKKHCRCQDTFLKLFHRLFYAKSLAMDTICKFASFLVSS